jgi:DNA-binding MurR/RpiR family transcriptional regulator
MSVSEVTQGSVIKLLESQAGNLSKAQRVLARYVLANYQTAAFSTIAELARLTGISEATIVRFAAALGFDGYPAFQRELRRLLRADLKAGERYALNRAVSAPADSPLRAIIAKELDNIAYLENHLDQTSLKSAVRTLQSANSILVAGERTTASLAHHLWFALDKLRLATSLADRIDTNAFDRISRMGPKDCLVVIGVSRYLASLVRLADYARERRVKIIAITDSPVSPFKADIRLSAPVESTSFISFHCAPLILINTLLETMSRANEKATLRALQDFEALAERANYFHES